MTLKKQGATFKKNAQRRFLASQPIAFYAALPHEIVAHEVVSQPYELLVFWSPGFGEHISFLYASLATKILLYFGYNH